MQIWRLLISINWISSTKEMNPITRKSMSKLVKQASFRAVGPTRGMVASTSFHYLLTKLLSSPYIIIGTTYIVIGPNKLVLSCLVLTFEKPENKRQMYCSQFTHAWLLYICLLFSVFFWVYHFACVWPTALKLGCIINFDMLFLVKGFISLVDEIPFMLISSRHICIRSMF